MRPIDADALLKAMGTWDKFGFSHSGAFVREPKNDDYVPYVHYEDMVKCVEGMPTIEPPMTSGYVEIVADLPPVEYAPVVRCKDCKYGTYYHGIYGCEVGLHDGDFFCANGERSEE